MFIVIDGPDGSGKTTLARRLCEKLEEDGFPSVYTCEPTHDSEPGKKIRHLLKTGGIEDVYAFADLFVEDRKIHIASLIKPALEQNVIVVCDRYKYSSLVYQKEQGVDAAYLVESNRSCLVPDLVFVLLPRSAEVLLGRIGRRGEARDIFEERDFLCRALECYRQLPSWFPQERILFLDAEASIEDHLKQIIPMARQT